jgi:DNA-binding NtrC family response regulator
MAKPVLIVEDDYSQARALANLLRQRMAFDAVTVANGREALDVLDADEGTGAIKLVILDVSMPIMDGMEALGIIRQRYPELPVIMLTGNHDVDDAVKATQLGAIDFITKPYEPERMAITVRNALKMSILTKEVTRLERRQEGALHFEDLIGHDAGLREAVVWGRKAAQSDIPVLVSGETGTGKELFARAIHGESAREGKPFIAVNCGAIPHQLVESTLFGHEKGAFTGATGKVYGKFREADGGTIFLDEVGELPLEAQVKLLRVLQQKEVEPVGAGRPVPVDVRVISATNRDLPKGVELGYFREDLFYRLNVLSVELPPLRDRLQDILPLAYHFIDRHCRAGDGIPKHMSPALVEYLEALEWRGNVRELENVINRALTISDSTALCIKDVSSNTEKVLSCKGLYQEPKTGEHVDAAAVSVRVISKMNKIKTMEEIEAETMEIVLDHYHGNVTKSAEALGIAKSTFYKKIKKYFPYFWTEGIYR